MPTYPGDPPVDVERSATHESDGYRSSLLTLPSHAGTHVDAPAHFAADGATVSDLPVDRFRFDARLVDCTGASDRDPIRPGDLPAATDADCLVLHTGWDAHWGTERYRDHPYLTAEAAALCVERDWAVAVDCYGPDPTPSPNASADEPSTVAAHRELLGAGQVLVENLRGLDALPERFTLRAYPLPVVGGDGAPARAVAEW